MNKGPIAPPAYAAKAREDASRAIARLNAEAEAILERAQTEARLADDNHVGTEHILLALLAVGQSAGGRALGKLGVTRELVLAQRYEEEGPSPPGLIPRTPRANRVLALAAEARDERGGGAIESVQLLLGVIAESEEWEASGRAGPHHLREALVAVGKDMADAREILG